MPNNKKPGYTENICLKFTAISAKIEFDNINVTQLNCRDALKPLDKQDFSIDYKSSPPYKVIAEIDQIFENQDPKNCVVDKCLIQEQNSKKNKKLDLHKKEDFEILAIQNLINGYN